VIGGALVASRLAGCQDQRSAQSGDAAGGEKSEGGEAGVSAVEDLMREHGVKWGAVSAKTIKMRRSIAFAAEKPKSMKA